MCDVPMSQNRGIMNPINFSNLNNKKPRKFDIHIDANFEIESKAYGKFTSRIHSLLSNLTSDINNADTLAIKVSALEISNDVGLNIGNPDSDKISDPSQSTSQRAKTFKSSSPLYKFEFLKVSQSLKQDLLKIRTLINEKELIFDQWNLRTIEPNPNLIFNFFGPPGTGKTLAAHALADYMDVPIMIAKYAQIEDKYVAEDAKNVEALFHAAERDGALLFIDEADALFSSRIINPSQGSEYGINALRATLLSAVDSFDGVAIVATNLVENIDSAFRSRMEYIRFELPCENLRKQIWKSHIPPELPFKDLSIDELAKIDKISGRDIKNAIINAALKARLNARNYILQQDLMEQVMLIKAKNELDKSNHQ